MKQLLLAGLAAAYCLPMAANTLYSADTLGEVVSVSRNGKYVAVADNADNLAYLWNIDNPTEFKDINAEGQALALCVSNDGIAAGATFNAKTGKYTPAYYKDGEWHALPVHAAVMYEAYAVAINDDASIIGGYQFISDATSEIKGRYYPCRWIRKDNVEGEAEPVYELECYIDIELPDHQGFITTCMSKDGNILGGRLFCGAGSMIPAIIKDGKLIYWNELEERTEPFEFKGEIIGYFTAYYIDGYHDGATGEYFVGEFASVDNDGNFYGARTIASNVNEDGRGKLTQYGCIYNSNTGEFTDIASPNYVSAGVAGGKVFFSRDAAVVEDGQQSTVGEKFNVTAPKPIYGISSTSADGKTLGGILYEIHPATGEYMYYPFAIVLDEPLVSGVDEIINTESDAKILLSAGRIDVIGAEEVAVYDLNGSLVSTSATSHVAPGVYVVKAGKSASKVIVK